MMTSPPRVSLARTDVGGFTLIEVIVTIAVAGILSGAILGLMAGQQRFYARNDSALLAEQNVRAAVDLMGAELRMASPNDIIVASADSAVVRFDILRAVICDTLSGGEADVFAFYSVDNANLPAAFRGTAYSGPYDSAFVYADAFTPTSAASAAAKTTCQSNGADPGGIAPNSDFRRTSGWQAQYGLTPQRGSLIRWYGGLTYGFGPSTSRPGSDAIWRNSQELLTPFEPGAGFQYVMASGRVQNSVNNANLTNIREIRIVVTATGDGPFNVRRPVTYDIPLRN